MKLSGSFCPFCSNQKLCDNLNCKYCFNKSFESHEKYIYWSDKNLVKPRQVTKRTAHKYIFNCNICNHEFLISPDKISKSWCPYCSNPPKLLCNNNDCILCLNKSFMSCDKYKLWSDKNLKIPRHVFLNSVNKFIFNCKYCNNEYINSPNIISKGVWCNCTKNKTESKLSSINN